MLAQIEPSRNDFHDLATYLIHGKERPTHPDRVAWVFGHNLRTDDPMRAADIMSAYAARSARCTNACYHMSVNWSPEEPIPTSEIMQEIARRVLDLAGLGEHQALVMGHGDKPHKHMHFMINRVHPETGRAWSTSHDYRRFDAIMKQLADVEYRFQHVPCHAFDPELTDTLPKGPDSAATWAAKRGAATDRMQWSNADARRYGEQISEHLDRATGWDDLDHLFAEDGLALEPKGTGFIVGSAASYAKLSALGLGITANGLVRRFGPRKPVQQPRWDALRVADERERLRLLLTGANGWTDLAWRLSLHGLALHRRGKGHVLADASGCTSLSSLGWSAAKIERHFADVSGKPVPATARAPPAPQKAPTRSNHHDPPPERRRSPPRRVVQAWAAAKALPLVDAVDIARAIGTKENVRTAIAEATSLRHARRARKPVIDQLIEDLMEQWRAANRQRPAHSRARKNTHPNGR